MKVNWNAAEAIGTILAVIVALFLPWWQSRRERRNRPVLNIDIRLSPPDCAFTKQYEEWVSGGWSSPRQTRTMIADVYVIRLFIENTGRSAARDVEVTVGDMRQRNGSASKPVSGFLLSNLVWTHYQRDTLALLLPETGKHIDLGIMRRPIDRKSKTRFRFTISVNPADGYNSLEPGEYAFTITAGAANSSPVRRVFTLSFNGEWDSDWQLMLGRYLTVRPAKLL